jgi:hypothetical protein
MKLKVVKLASTARVSGAPLYLGVPISCQDHARCLL